jgi:hypothetical protein
VKDACNELKEESRTNDHAAWSEASAVAPAQHLSEETDSYEKQEKK